MEGRTPTGKDTPTGDDEHERRRLTVVSAGLREPSSTRLLADRLSEATVAALAQRGVSAEVTVVEVREHAHDLTNALSTGFASPALQAALDAVIGADGLIAVTPIFSGSYSGLFKTFFDVIEDGALAGMPVLLGATAGTARHSLALEHAIRPLFAYLRTLTAPTGVFGATEDFGAAQPAAPAPEPGSTVRAAATGSALAARVHRAAGELAPLVLTRPARVGLQPPTALAAPTSFEQLLTGRR
ncbi:FMN reductase [Kineococcus sp. SYSU DK005]|uniref:FMN reductase n=1 Tax=Kineococcus sp. SYSU DK005 TaxID=3383126 RepID=UPI003D7EA473